MTPEEAAEKYQRIAAIAEGAAHQARHGRDEELEHREQMLADLVDTL